MRVRRGALILAVILNVAILGALCCLAPSMHPVRRASVAQFWSVAARVDIGGSGGRGCGTVTLHKGRFVYNDVGMDDFWAYWIPESEAMARWPDAQAALERLSATTPDNVVAIGYQRWKALSAREQNGIVGLNQAIGVAVTEKIMRENPGRLPVGDVFAWDRQAVASCAEKMDWYWATFCFEFLFLGGLAWWILWPVMRGSGLVRYLIHWGLAPTLFLLPNWLGYAIRIPCVLENGGILYAWLIHFAGQPRSNAGWEVALLTHLPRLLEPLCQHVWIDPWGPGGWARIGWTIHGPISALIAGGSLMGLMLFGAIIERYVLKPLRQKHEPRGFEVIMDKSVSSDA